MTEIIYEKEVYAIVGAAIEVYNQMGPGFLEAVYQEALEIEFAAQGVPFCSQPQLKLTYKSRQLKKVYIPDFTAYGKIIVELKAIDNLTRIEEAQLINELRCSGYIVGVLLNFGAPWKLDWMRKVLTKNAPPKQIVPLSRLRKPSKQNP
jgi:GxxExxY protein